MEPIKGFENYLITKDGKIFSNRKQLSLYLHKCGYYQVILNYKCVRVHRMIANTFIPNPENKPEVNHINGIKTDNRVENLEWNTKSENQIHAHKLGLHKIINGGNRGELHGNHKLNKNQVLKIRELCLTGNYYQKELAIMFNINHRTISDIVNKKLWKSA